MRRHIAVLQYLDADFKIIEPGEVVLCAVTGAEIPVGDLKYWSVERQEPYVSAVASLEGHQRATGKK